MPPFESLPYRRCVGMVALNRNGLAFVGRRIDGPEHTDDVHVWQMPQGGIDRGEDPWPAALRELREETNITSVERLGEIAEWLTYDIPRDLVAEAWNGKYRGQKQKWFLMLFTGTNDDIDLAFHKPEFSRWKWLPFEDLPKVIVGFKRKLYRQVVAEFRDAVAKVAGS